METWFPPRRLPGRLGPVGVLRLLVLQLIVVGMIALLARGTPVALGGAVAALATAVTFGRRRGRWWTEHARLWLRFQRRRRAGWQRARDPRLTALRQLAPDLAVENVAGAEGSQLGLASDGAGWFAVLEVTPVDADVDPPVPLPALARIAAQAEQPGVVMQVVSHTLPAPEGLGGRQRLLWVAVRLDADTVADSLIDDPDRQVGVPAVLAELTRRVERTLRRRGLKARPLDADGLVDALTLACDLGPAPPGERPAVGEDWYGWRSPRLVHRCFWLARWPDPERGTSLLASLNDHPDARVSIALVLEPRAEGEPANLLCLVRIAAAPQLARRSADQAGWLAAQLGGELFPVDGEHALAVYATAPTGGGAR